MGLKDRISEYLDFEISLPAVGQGALVLETREADPRIQELVNIIHHETTALCTQTERAFLNRLQGGCQIPIAGHAWIQGERIILKGLIAGLDGRKIIKDQLEGPLSDPLGLGIRLAETLLKAGGQEILEGVLEKKA